jgi:hypothetical protein
MKTTKPANLRAVAAVIWPTTKHGDNLLANLVIFTHYEVQKTAQFWSNFSEAG